MQVKTNRNFYRSKRMKDIKQRLQNTKILNILNDKIAQDEFEKSEYQRTGIQH